MNQPSEKNTGPKPATPETGGATWHPLDRYTVQPAAAEGDQSPFYKSAAPQISLPKGGGALKGIDEKLNVNAVNGTAGIDIALPLSPGRAGFTPALSLSYNSGSGNSPFGLGWSLGLPSIRRKAEGRLPRYNDAGESDAFLLAGAEDLTPYVFETGETPPAAAGYTIKRYRPRIEGLFARIEFIKKNGTSDSWWRVTTKENITTYYGLTTAARIADPEHAYRIFEWLPQLTVDNKGNAQLYEYKAEDLLNVSDALHERNRKAGLQPVANTYLKRVLYCNHNPFFISGNGYEPALPAAAPADWHMQAVWDYGDVPDIYNPSVSGNWPCRKDPFSDYRAGFEIRTYRLCRRVLMYHTFAELAGGTPTLVRSLELQYQNDGATANFVETDFIVKATQRGYDGTYSRALPAMQFHYHPFVWNTALEKVAPEDFQNAPQGLTGPYQWIDLEGEGLPGILGEHGQGWFYKHNLGGGHFTPAKRVAKKPSFAGLASGVLAWEDLEGNGERQVVSRAEGAEGYWQAKGPYPTTETETQLDWEPFRPFPKNLNLDKRSPHVLSLDLNGDGKADTLIADDRVFTWYENRGKKGYDEGGTAPGMAKDEERGPVLVLRDRVQSIFLADMSGDGLTDLVRIRNGEVCYWPNLGYGKFGAKVAMSAAPHFHEPDLYNPLYLTLADISGTGVADLIYIGDGKIRAWINYSGNAFSPAYDIGTLPATDAYSKIAVLDFLGKGTACIVWSSPLPHYAHAPLQYIDLMGGKKPYILHRYANGMGKEVALTYKSSTHYYLTDKKAGTPWATRLPFPVQCVATVTTTDTVSETAYSQSYSYHHGYYDPEEREFRGFGRVDVVDTDTATVTPSFGGGQGEALNQAPVLTKTWYHTGAFRREKTLLDAYREEYFHFAGWDDAPYGEDVVTFSGNLSPLELREAHRALKGSVLRQEVYALDGTAQQSIPYTVTASAYEVKLIQGLPPGYSRDGNREEAPKRAVFLTLVQQRIVFSCERAVADVRIGHELTLETDRYGNVLKKAEVVYPRYFLETPAANGLPAKVQQEQAKMWISFTGYAYTNDVETPAAYRLRLPWEEKSGEAVLPVPSPRALWKIPGLLGALNAAPAIPFPDALVTGQKQIRRHTKTLFKADDAQTVLGWGVLQSLAIVHEQYALAFCADAYADLYDGEVTPAMLQEGGYKDVDGDGCYWLPSGTAQYISPAAHFYTPTVFTDPWGNATTVAYDAYDLLPKKITDAAGNEITVTAYDYRVLQPTEIKDPNDNLSRMRYDALGMPAAMALLGKGGEGDNLTNVSLQDDAVQALFWADPQAYAATLLGNATMRLVYDLDVQPMAVAMIARERHYAEMPNSPLLIRITYTDGLGRVLMHKAQCEPTAENGGAEWVGSGRTVYNNKGKAVMQYEPYFSPTHLCDTAAQADARGVTALLHYDPLGRLYRTDLPDGSFTQTEWTSWSQSLWDNNDTVLSSQWYLVNSTGSAGEQDAAAKAAAHAGTPTVLHLDTLARPFYTIQIFDSSLGGAGEAHSYENLDIEGNRLSVVDGRGKETLKYRYNMLGLPCVQQSVDSGQQLTLVDVAGQPLYGWDADGRPFHYLYDALRRPVEKWGEGRLLESYLYGEGQPNDKDLNLRGQLYQLRDGAGQLTHAAYDFKGNLLETARQLLDDPTIGDADWSAALGLNPEVFISYATYDALNRLVDTKDPGSNIQEYTYDRGGYLKTVLLNGAAYVQDIHYDAKGQRQAIWYGNDTKTSYAYEAATFRLRRLLTVNLATNDMVQDLRYWYDPVGNITRIGDEAQQTLFYANQLVSPEQDFTYDALYRLVKASGREQIADIWPAGMNDNWDDGAYKAPLGGDAAQNYSQRYSYDAVGNILELKHIAGVGSYTRSYGYGTSNNKLVTTEVGGTVYTYGHDGRGNMTQMPHLDAGWGLQNQMSTALVGGIKTFYQYSSGERIRKYTDKGSVKEERIYLGSYEVYRKYDVSGNLTLERTTVHVSDDTGRIAMLETRTQGSDPSPASLTRYIYSNHLQSATLELDDSGQVISYEEYHPYGTTAYQASNSAINAVAKRYRFSGKERDEESGLYYHGARYYTPWLARWTSPDPINNDWYNLEKGYGIEKNRERNYLELTASSYEYCYDNPVNYTDPTGEQVPPEQNNIEVNISVYKYNPNLKRGELEYTFSPVSVPMIDDVPRSSVNVAVLQADIPVKRGNMTTYETRNVGFYIDPHSGETPEEELARKEPLQSKLYTFITKVNPLGPAASKTFEALGGEKYTSVAGTTRKLTTAERATSAAAAALELIALGKGLQSKAALQTYAWLRGGKEVGEAVIDHSKMSNENKDIGKYLVGLGLTIYPLLAKSPESFIDVVLSTTDVASQSSDFILKVKQQSRRSDAVDTKDAVYKAFRMLNIQFYYGK